MMLFSSQSPSFSPETVCPTHSQGYSWVAPIRPSWDVSCLGVLVVVTRWERVNGVLMVWWGGMEPPTSATRCQNVLLRPLVPEGFREVVKF